MVRLLAVSLGVALALAARPAGAWSGGVQSLSDGTLRVPLPSGWAGSVGPGMQGSHRVAWLLTGDFAFAANAASHEGTPWVPAHRVLIVIGDFFPAGPSLRWRSVRMLHEPRSLLKQSGSWWRVRFRGRAVAVSVRFGSPPTVATIARAERVLAQVTPCS